MAGGQDFGRRGREDRDGESGCMVCCRKGRRSRWSKKAYNPSEAEVSEASMEDLLTYEVVNLYYPLPRIKRSDLLTIHLLLDLSMPNVLFFFFSLCRPIILIGPPNVGRHELRNRLVLFDAERFTSAVIHTTRLAKANETEGTYSFISRQKFEEVCLPLSVLLLYQLKKTKELNWNLNKQ